MPDATYASRKDWIDQERYVPLKEELYAKSGQLLKKTVMSDIARSRRPLVPHENQLPRYAQRRQRH